MRFILAALVALFASVVPVSSFGYDDPGYPYTKFEGCRTTCFTDDNGFCKNNCTSYVAWILRRFGVSFSNSYRLERGDRWGDGGLWDNAAGRIEGSRDISVTGTPIPGDVAYWNTLGGTGHVAFVEKVHYDSNGNATGIDVTEYNINPCRFGYRTNLSVTNPDGYIHILAYEEGVSHLYYADCIEMSGLCDSQTPQEWEWIKQKVAQYRCKDCGLNQYTAYVDGFYDGSGFGGSGVGPQPIPGPRTDLRPDFDVYNLNGNEVSANCNNCMGKSLDVGQTVKPKLWTQVSNASAGNFKRNSSSDSIEGPIWWMIEGKTGWNPLGSGEYTISKLDNGEQISETHTFVVPNYPGDILVMAACVDGDDEIWEEGETSDRNSISSPDDYQAKTNNCSRRERFYINHPNYTPTGAIESGDCAVVKGWAKDDNATGSLQITVSDSGLQVIPSFFTGVNRIDLGGNYGIEWTVPDSIRDGNQHILTFSAVNVPAGPNPEIGSVTLTCMPPVPAVDESAVWLIFQQ